MNLEEELRERFLLQGIATGPATIKEIDSLESALGHPLPVAYRAYLRVCGTHPPKHLIGSDCVIGCLVDNNKAAMELLADNGINKPDAPMVTFLMHQGYFFEYFLIDESDDPLVYSYMEGDKNIKPSVRHFSEWVGAIPGHMTT
ncbi:MAG TPA: SMI1/KNR4 family protein [Caulifigura sp.]|jgi:hypothetical protein|nr:SMI1/KNR4 family protein [Caulifigura sp.]